MATVLVIEDDPDILALATDLLDFAGYRVVGARDGLDGLTLAQSELPDLVLCDVGLPSLDGREVARRLRAGPDSHAVPIVLMSGYAESEMAGAPHEAFVAKPFDIDELLRAVCTCIDTVVT